MTYPTYKRGYVQDQPQHGQTERGLGFTLGITPLPSGYG
jgi:hypothetical protein